MGKNGARMSEKNIQLRQGRGGFFAIDRRIWAKLCGADIDMAVAYLVLARGTGRDNRTTFWSVNSVEERTNIARQRAKEAIQRLVGGGLLRQDRGGTRPGYCLLPAHEVAGCVEAGKPLPLTVEEAGLLAKIGDKQTRVPKVGRRGSRNC